MNETHANDIWLIHRTLAGVEALEVLGEGPVILLVTDDSLEPFCDLLEWFFIHRQAAIVFNPLERSGGNVRWAADVLNIALYEIWERVALVGISWGCVIVDEVVRHRRLLRPGGLLVKNVTLVGGPSLPLPRATRRELAAAARKTIRMSAVSVVLGGAVRIDRVVRARTLLGLYRKLVTDYEPKRIPGEVLVVVPQDDGRFSPEHTERDICEPVGKPPGYKPRQLLRIPGDRFASGPDASRELGARLQRFARSRRPSDGTA